MSTIFRYNHNNWRCNPLVVFFGASSFSASSVSYSSDVRLRTDFDRVGEEEFNLPLARLFLGFFTPFVLLAFDGDFPVTSRDRSMSIRGFSVAGWNILRSYSVRQKAGHKLCCSPSTVTIL